METDLDAGPDSHWAAVLVIDDDAAQRALARAILEDRGFSVTEANCGGRGVEMVDAAAFDLILLDKHLPDMDGNDFCRAVRGRPHTEFLPIILVTGDGSDSAMVSGLRAGAADFIRKPFMPTELLIRCESAINRKTLTDQLDTTETVLCALARLAEARDRSTAQHCARLVHACRVFADRLGLSPRQVELLTKGAFLHDVGKIGIPDRILLKPEKLTADEWRVMRRHPVIGAELCSQLRSLRAVTPIVRHHHERWDGSGYPDGLAGEDIPLLARVFQLADIFDALRYRRSYHAGRSVERVAAHLEDEVERGWRDPQLATVFIDLVRSHALEIPDSVRSRPAADSGCITSALIRDVCRADHAGDFLDLSTTYGVAMT